MAFTSRPLAALAGAIPFLMTGCGSSLQRVTASEFVELASRERSSMFAATYIGHSRNWSESRARVYLEVWSMGVGNPSGTDVYWTPLAEFSREIVDSIRAGRDPFTAPADREDGTTDDDGAGGKN